MASNQVLSARKKRHYLADMRLVIFGYHIPVSASIIASWLQFASYTIFDMLYVYCFAVATSLVYYAYAHYCREFTGNKAKILIVFQTITWIIAFSWWVYILDEIRVVALMSAIMAFVIAFVNTDGRISSYLTLATAMAYMAVSYFSNFIHDNMPAFYFDLFLMYLFIPTALYVAYMANIIRIKQMSIKNMNKKLLAANEQVTASMQTMEELNQKLSYLTYTDELTELHNRRSMENIIDKQLQDYQQYRKTFCLLICDIDYFKEINDRYGHQTGDLAIKAVAQVMTQMVDQQAYTARWGGEEFLILLPDSNKDAALALAEKIRSEVAVLNIPTIDKNITISIGVAEMVSYYSTENLFKYADRALYQAKSSGRNRTCLWCEKTNAKEQV